MSRRARRRATVLQARCERRKIRIRLKRVHAPPAPTDGQRLLVDRYWPRGLTKAKACVDAWLSDLAPSKQLLSWFRAHPEQWDTFQKRYEAELISQAPQVSHVRQLASQQTVTLVYTSKHRTRLPARILAQHLVSPEEALQDPEVQRAFLRQIRRQSRYAQYAFAQLDGLHHDEQRVKQAVAGTIELGAADDDYHPEFLADKLDEFIHMNIQQFLVAAVNVSKMLYGGSEFAPTRPAVMRDLVGPLSESSLLKDRTLRNFFEHFDERLDRWAVNAPSRDIDVDDYVVELTPVRDLWFPKIKIISGSATFDLGKLAMCVLGVEMAVNAKLRTLVDRENWAAEGLELE